MSDELWQPEAGNPLASRAENERVREMLREELLRRAEAEHSHSARPLGAARGDFAVDWVALAQKLGLKQPGDPRTPLREGETREERRVDAARTRLRQFLAGHREQDWVLVGIEATICDRRGFALPGKAYQTQQQLLTEEAE